DALGVPFALTLGAVGVSALSSSAGDVCHWADLGFWVEAATAGRADERRTRTLDIDDGHKSCDRALGCGSRLACRARPVPAGACANCVLRWRRRHLAVLRSAPVRGYALVKWTGLGLPSCRASRLLLL